MKRIAKRLILPLIAIVLVLALVLSGCSSNSAYVTSIAKTGSNGSQDIYTIYYSDGSTDSFSIENGVNGEDGKDVSIMDIYQTYKEQTGDSDLSFQDFLDQYLTLSTDMSAVISQSLQSIAKIYAEFIETTSTGGGIGGILGRPSYSTSNVVISTGAAVIYSIDESQDGYTYFVTDYHVIYDNDADSTKNDGSKIARSVYAYLYGSEGSPSAVDENGDGQADTDSNGYTVYDYGDYAIPLEYVGGTITYDIAVLRAKTSDVKAINENAQAVRFAQEYHVGETAIAIGNPEGTGLSVTQGIISTESEYITLQIDDTARSYRSVRIDTALYSGNSGGGLFNKKGELIGITNAGDSSDQNINYAVSLEIVRGTADSIIFYANDGNTETDGVSRLLLGVTVTTQNSKYVYDPSSGYGKISEEVVIASVSEDSIAQTLGLLEGDILTAVIINGTQYEIDRSFEIENLSLTVRANDLVQIVYTRNGESFITQQYTVSYSDLTQVQ